MSASVEQPCELFRWPQPGELWSLWDMLAKFSPRTLIALGERLNEADTVISMAEGMPDTPLDDEEKADIRKLLEKLRELAQQLELTTAIEQLSFVLSPDCLPTTRRELMLAVQPLKIEVKRRAMYFIPQERAEYYGKENLLTPDAAEIFHGAAHEITDAANCFALEQYTACVFHVSRALEHALKSLAEMLKCEFGGVPIELVDWHNLIDQCASKIDAMKSRQKGREKSDDLKFFSDAALEFRYIKDAYRVRVAHAREVYSSDQAKKILHSAGDFMNALAPRVKGGSLEDGATGQSSP